MPRLYDLYMDNLTVLKTMTVFMALLSAMVMCLDGQLVDMNNNLTYLITIFPKWVWAGMFGVFAASRAVDVYIACSRWFASFLTSVLGIWLWSLLLASATIVTPIVGVDLMLIVPLFAELWILSRLIEGRKGT